MEDSKIHTLVENSKDKKNRLLILLISVFFIHIVLFGLFDTNVFPGFSASIILFAVSFVILSLFFYLIQKKYFFKLSVFFSRKFLLSIIFLYIVMLISTIVSTIHSISTLEKDNTFKNIFPAVMLGFDYKNFVTLRNVVIVSSSVDYTLDEQFDEKIQVLRQLNTSIELHFKKEDNDKEFSIMLAHYPDFIYRKSTKLFFSFILYLYLFTIYWLLSQYLQRDAKVKHALGIFTLIFPIYFLFFAFSGAFGNGLFPIILKPDKSILEYLNDEYDATKMSKQVPLGLNNIYIKISLKDKK